LEDTRAQQPKGSLRLPEALVSHGEAALRALTEAMSGHAREDDSQGHPLAADCPKGGDRGGMEAARR
jgi:hypothetical protein